MASSKASATREKYGLLWNKSISDLEIEFWKIRDCWKKHLAGKECFEEIIFHYLNCRKLIWPDRYEHRWTRLIYGEIIRNSISIFMGAASTQKTSHISEFILIDYWCYPNNTAILISSTSREKLDDAIWGEIKMLWSDGKQQFPELAGYVIDYKQRISTDPPRTTKDENQIESARDLRKGIFCKACFIGSQWVGLGNFAGIKQERMRFVPDELQFMSPTFLACLPNMRSNVGYGGLKVIGSGNPNHDTESQLGIVAEPLEGWKSVEGQTKTSTWPIKLMGGRCINLVGIDSPNFDQEKDIYVGLIGHKFEEIIAHDYGKNSPEYETQVMGRMKLDLAFSRVITRQSCREHHAHDEVVWESEPTKIYATDPSYGGKDRCVTGYIEFGKSVGGKIVIRVPMPKVLKFVISETKTIEEQIADSIFNDCKTYKISPTNAFYDSTGKGTIGFALSHKFGDNCPIPIAFGGKPSKRPVREGLYVEDNGRKRLKQCDEHYSKFVTELWFSARYTIESEQMRELPEEVMHEGCMRKYYNVSGDKIEVEPKDDMKERLGKSPDLFDWLCIAIEGARQRGFKIDKLGGEDLFPESNQWQWFKDLQKKQMETRKEHSLNFSV